MADVGIALLTLVPGELGGSETYARGLLDGLAEVGELDYRVVLPPVAAGFPTGLEHEVATEYRRAATIPQRLVAMSLATTHPGPLRARLENTDVVHYPLTLRLPTVPRPSVVTLHDVQHLDLPQLFPRSERLFRALAWHRSIRGADRVIVMSEFVRDRAIAALGLDPDRVRVVPLGLDHDRLRPGAAREPFLFYPARRWPHKNHERLYEAFAIVRKERPELSLVLTGGGDFSDAPAGVDSRGHVPWGEVVTLLQTASALVFPSLYEGFGLPPLEAMACGCPVACSDAGALPEVVDGAARLFDPYEPAAIAEGVLEVLGAPDSWVERGLERAANYSWSSTARATEQVYRELLP